VRGKYVCRLHAVHRVIEKKRDFQFHMLLFHGTEDADFLWSHGYQKV